jgi:hypothetical protein
MIKMMICAPRREGLSHGEFRDYVLRVHGPLVRSVTEVAADIRHYHYNFPLQDVSVSTCGYSLAAPFDIVTEAWFDSVAAQLRNMEHPRYLQIVRPDEHRFANGAAALVHYMNVKQVFGRQQSRYKLFVFRSRPPGVARGVFQRGWLERVSELLADRPDLRGALTGYVQNHAVSDAEHPGGVSGGHYDVIDEFLADELPALQVLDGPTGLRATVSGAVRDLAGGLADLACLAETIVNIP